jgi:chromosome segregation ATPase
MKRFRFSLERVHQWRQLRMDRELAELQRRFAVLHGVEQEEQKVRLQGRQAEGALDDAGSPGAPVHSYILARLDVYRRSVRHRLSELSRRREEADREIALQRERLLDARRDVMLLDKLKDKSQRRWYQAHLREIETFAGEVYLARWAQRRPGAPET